MKLTIYDKAPADTVLIVLFFLFMMTVPRSLFSRPLPQEEIRPAVETWVRYVTADARPDAVIEDMDAYIIGGKLIAYIAHLADSGFCICGADDRLLPVYVYSPGGIYDPENETYKYFLGEMTQWINIIDELQRSGDADMSKYSAVLDERAVYWSDLASGIISVKDRGLYDGPDQLKLDMTSVWDQWSPYNYYCPTLPPLSDDHCAIGCGAGAMAAIMRYWEWPVTGVGNGSTLYYYRHISDWDSEDLVFDPSIPEYWWVEDRLSWIPDEGGKLRMMGYWDGSLYDAAINIRPTYVYVGTSGGVFRSTNNGNNWAEINDGLTFPNVQAFAINSSDHIFAGTYGGGAFRSMNYGNSWTEINDGLTKHLNVRALAVNSADCVFAGTIVGGVYRSTSNGDSWESACTGLINTNVLTLAINSDNHLFAGTDGGGVFRSTNNGNSWEHASDGMTNLDVQTLAIDLNNRLFAGTDGGGVFRSVDNGGGWDQITSGLTNLDIQTLAVNSGNNLFAGTYGGGVFRSTDNGNSWEAAREGLTNLYIKALAVSSTDCVFAGTDGGGVFLSIDSGNSWTKIDDGLTNATAKALDIPSGHLIAQDYLIALDVLYNRLNQYVEEWSANFDIPYEWDLMEDAHWDPFGPEDEAIAALCYNVGVSIGMKYGINGSGVSYSPSGISTEAYVNNFRYDSDVEFVELEIGDYGEGVDNMMEEIQWLRPVQYESLEHVHEWVIFGYNRTFLPESIQWGMNSVNGRIDWCIFDPIFSMHRFTRYIAPESVVRFVGSTSSGDGSPDDPYMNIEEAVADAPDGTTLIFKAGSDNTFSAAPLEIHNKQIILRGKGAVIRKESP